MQQEAPQRDPRAGQWCGVLAEVVDAGARSVQVEEVACCVVVVAPWFWGEE